MGTPARGGSRALLCALIRPRRYRRVALIAIYGAPADLQTSAEAAGIRNFLTLTVVNEYSPLNLPGCGKCNSEAEKSAVNGEGKRIIVKAALAG